MLTSLQPIAQTILPQFGSEPKIAAFTKLDMITDLPTTRASVKEAAPFTVTSINLLAPSPSLAMALANSDKRG